ncbi:hypothetical protein AB5I41_12080 [Sphingomonas sp. MMS24-JH45]
MPIVAGGKVMALDYSRFWAAKQGKLARVAQGNIIMAGGTESTADLVRSTSRGILVAGCGTSAWSIRRRCC